MPKNGLASPTLRRVGVGIALCIVAAALLGAVTEDVVNHDPLTHFDDRVLEVLHQHVTPTGIAIATFISRLGSPFSMTILALAGASVLVWRREWIVLGGWMAAFLGAGLLQDWLKVAIHRPRPGYATEVLNPLHSTWSFPSGHAMGALIGYGMLAYVLCLLATRNPRMRLGIVTATTVLIVAIGVSRLYLGVHYFSDVVGGYAAGIIWLFTCASAVELARRWRRRSLRLHPTG